MFSVYLCSSLLSKVVLSLLLSQQCVVTVCRKSVYTKQCRQAQVSSREQDGLVTVLDVCVHMQACV
jgi:hypothetical protein